MSRKNTTTIRDIARHAGVSVSTASLALNGDDRVRPETRQRVLDAASALDYHPSRAARSLSHGRTYAVHLLNPLVESDLSSSFFTRFANGVHDEAHLRHYTVALTLLKDEQEAFEALEKMVLERWCDGVILMNPSEDGAPLDLLRRRGFPHVLLGRAAVPGVATIDNDNERVAYDAARHLLDRGVAPLVLLNGPARHTFTQDRAQGFQRACRETGWPDPEVLFTAGSTAAAREAVRALWDRPDPPAGLVAVSDRLAVGALQELRALGIAVPAGVAVIGMNNDDLCEVTTPRLSSIDLDAYKLGRSACELLFEQMGEGASHPVPRIVSHRLVVRESSP